LVVNEAAGHEGVGDGAGTVTGAPQTSGASLTNRIGHVSENLSLLVVVAEDRVRVRDEAQRPSPLLTFPVPEIVHAIDHVIVRAPGHPFAAAGRRAVSLFVGGVKRGKRGPFGGQPGSDPPFAAVHDLAGAPPRQQRGQCLFRVGVPVLLAGELAGVRGGFGGERGADQAGVLPLPHGLSEWAVHPARPIPADSGSDVRSTDHDFLLAPSIRQALHDERVDVLGYGDPMLLPAR